MTFAGGFRSRMDRQGEGEGEGTTPMPSSPRDLADSAVIGPPQSPGASHQSPVTNHQPGADLSAHGAGITTTDYQ